MSWETFSSHVFWKTFSSRVLRSLHIPCLEKPSAPMSWETFSSHVLRNDCS
jgi:hypothetical protein